MKTRLDRLPRATLAAALSLTTLLAACGGGGGGSAPTTTSTPTGSTAPTSTNTGSTTTPQYPAGSQELAALNQINAMRQQCGFSELSENTLLDQAAVNHMGYMNQNPSQGIGHNEVAGDPGFTGVNPVSRFQYVGYQVLNNEGAEVISPDSSDVGGAASVVSLASTPYHLSGMFYPLAEVGLKYATVALGPAAIEYTLLMDLSNQASTANLATVSHAPLTFPCQGTTGVDYESAKQETPSPYNGQPVNTGTNPIGTPITVVGNLSDTVLLTSGTMMDPNGNPITLNLTDSSNDPNHILAPFAAFAFPTNPLLPNTNYSVVLNGTINGTPFSRNFSFTTGNQGQF
jgi:uncharacterized protein YkwD